MGQAGMPRTHATRGRQGVASRREFLRSREDARMDLRSLVSCGREPLAVSKTLHGVLDRPTIVCRRICSMLAYPGLLDSTQSLQTDILDGCEEHQVVFGFGWSHGIEEVSVFLAHVYTAKYGTIPVSSGTAGYSSHPKSYQLQC